MGSPQLTLQTQGAAGLLATPMQGSVQPLQQALVAQVKTEDDKAAMPPPVRIAPVIILHLYKNYVVLTHFEECEASILG